SRKKCWRCWPDTKNGKRIHAPAGDRRAGHFERAAAERKQKRTARTTKAHATSAARNVRVCAGSCGLADSGIRARTTENVGPRGGGVLHRRGAGIAWHRIARQRVYVGKFRCVR